MLPRRCLNQLSIEMNFWSWAVKCVNTFKDVRTVWCEFSKPTFRLQLNIKCKLRAEVKLKNRALATQLLGIDDVPNRNDTRIRCHR